MTYLKMKKSLGQNFLKDEFYISKIIDSFELKPDDIILEIGPGGGALTSRLSGKVKKLYAVEIDQRLIDNLSEKIGEENFDLHNEDFLKFDFESIVQEDNVKIVGNLPYHVTSPIIFKVMELASELNKERPRIKSLTMMIQKEVAERIVARTSTKEYGILSVMVRFFSDPEILFDVPPEAFFPKPKVTSSIVRLNFGTGSGNIDKVKDFSLFRAIVKTTFLNRRKMLRNTLKTFVKDISSVRSVEVTRRPETLSVDDFIDLSNEIFLM